MIRRVLDASVAVAWYLPEAFSKPARRRQQMLLDGKAEFYAPSLHYWEFANVLRTYVMRAEIDAATAHEIYHLHLDAPIISVEPRRDLVLEFALEYGATVYDAVYIALCIEMEAPILTAECSSTPWLKKLGKLADPIQTK
jgi:predicted nucleic acid-binding protein